MPVWQCLLVQYPLTCARILRSKRLVHSGCAFGSGPFLPHSVFVPASARVLHSASGSACAFVLFSCCACTPASSIDVPARCTMRACVTVCGRFAVAQVLDSGAGLGRHFQSRRGEGSQRGAPGAWQGRCVRGSLSLWGCGDSLAVVCCQSVCADMTL